MNIKLKTFFIYLAYGTALTVIDVDTDEEVKNTDSFTVPYTIPTGYENATVECVGIIDNRMYIWIKR